MLDFLRNRLNRRLPSSQRQLAIVPNKRISGVHRQRLIVRERLLSQHTPSIASLKLKPQKM
jgi:hypothetical protein